MFSEEQLKRLSAPLDNARVKSRDKSGIALSYLEGHDVISTANSIFGFGNWSYTVKELAQISEETNQKGNIVVGYKALIEITIYSDDRKFSISRNDVGFGNGVSKSSFDAHELAGKESITDGLKRAFRTFGEQFGNGLYDKGQNNNSYKAPATRASNQGNGNQMENITKSLKAVGLNLHQENNTFYVQGNTYGKGQFLKRLGFNWNAQGKVWYKNAS